MTRCHALSNSHTANPPSQNLIVRRLQSTRIRRRSRYSRIRAYPNRCAPHSVWTALKPCLHDTTASDCIVRQTFNRLFNRLYEFNLFDACNPTSTVHVVQTYNLLFNRFHNRLSNRLHRVNKHSTGCETGCTTGLTTGCIVSCKRGLMC